MTLKKILDNILEKLVVVLMSALVLDVLWQVFARYLLNSPSSFSDELARFLLIWVGLSGAALATGKNLHLALDIFTSKITDEGWKKGLEVLVQLLIMLFALLVMIVGGLRLTYITFSLEQHSPALGIPVGFVYLIIPITGLVIMIYSLLHIMKVLSTKTTT